MLFWGDFLNSDLQPKSLSDESTESNNKQTNKPENKQSNEQNKQPQKQTNEEKKANKLKNKQPKSSTEMAENADISVRAMSNYSKPAIMPGGYPVIAWAKISVITTHQERKRKFMSLNCISSDSDLTFD